MSDNNTQAPNNLHIENKSLKNVIIILLAAMLVMVIGFYCLIPLLGITIAISASAWIIAVSAIVILAIASLLFFIFTGIGILVTAIVACFFGIIAIILVPLLFPIIVPVLLLMAVIMLVMRKKQSQ